MEEKQIAFQTSFQVALALCLLHTTLSLYFLKGHLSARSLFQDGLE